MKNFLKRSFALALMCVVTAAGSGFNIMSADATTGEYKSWKQGDSRWGSVYLGSSGQTLSRIGCAVTSVAMLMVHSGSMSDESFDPGKLCNYLSSNGGFDGYGNIRWAAATGLESSFTYQGGGTLSGSQSAKSSEIASYLASGYYAIVSVKYGGHWVAIDHVDSNGTVYMIDPARGTNTDLFSVYSASGVGQIRLFKGANSKSSSAAVTQKPAETTTTAATTKAPAVTTTAAAAVTEAPAATTTPAASSENNQPAVTEAPAQTSAPAETTAPVTTAETEEVKENVSEYKEGRYTSSDVLNIRSKAGTENSILTALPANTSVFVYEVSGEWGKISYNGTEGWINLKYTNYGGVVPFFTAGLYSTVADLNLRTEADINSKSQLIIPVGTTLPVTDIKENWGKVEYNGTTGWICMDYTSYDGDSQSAEIEEKKDNSRIGEYLTFDEVNLREAPDSTKSSICRIPGYAKLNVTEVTEDNWGKVSFKGKTGWICLDYAKLCSKSVIAGDINGDGYITINDVNLLRQEILNNRKFTAAEIAVSDVNNDGKVDNADVEIIEKQIG